MGGGLRRLPILFSPGGHHQVLLCARARVSLIVGPSSHAGSRDLPRFAVLSVLNDPPSELRRSATPHSCEFHCFPSAGG